MEKMISVASGFQYSVNIGYDLNDNDKLKNFIPTKSSLELLEEILLSTNSQDSNRARVLIGAYGKGKSHIVLSILSILNKKPLKLFEKMMPKIEGNDRLLKLIDNYYASNKKILPVVITGSSTSLSQAFLLALQRALSDNDLMDIMPATNYKAAISKILSWKNDYPDVYEKLSNRIDENIDEFISKLDNFNIHAYEKFEIIHMELTAGTKFNPFLGFDVIELYETVAKGIESKGYSGLYIVYDEFSKYLESNITSASLSDTKMLQDFAEKCNRSAELQMHIMLISHKEISNYIDKLPKKKIDGWKGVSDRFYHVHLNNNFSQTYEIIANVINKDEKKWAKFKNTEKNRFNDIIENYRKHRIFDGCEDVEKIIFSCYPLHPVSTFILPRISEKVAQNERTLFTFLSAKGISTLDSFLMEYNEEKFSLVTPDYIYDYFEPLLKKEMYSGHIHKMYTLTSTILTKLEGKALETKIVKCLALMYLLEQFEILSPIIDEIINIYRHEYLIDDIKKAINVLIAEELVVYLKRSNNFLQLKETSGVNIKDEINKLILNGKRSTVKEILNESNFDMYLYPSRYNDEREMTRYFSFNFIDEDEIYDDVDWEIKNEDDSSDGFIYGIILKETSDYNEVKNKLIRISKGYERFIFIILKENIDIANIAIEFNAVKILREKSISDKVLYDEYDVVYTDLQEVITEHISYYTKPEKNLSTYISNGKIVKISRKVNLSEFMSNICDSVFSMTPIINNEVINKNEITTVAKNSRDKIINGLLRNEIEKDLGLTGFGQEVSIMRSTLTMKNIIQEKNNMYLINLNTDDNYINNVFKIIEDFIVKSKTSDKCSFSDLYNSLIKPEYKIGLRKGVIPIYIAAVFHNYKQQIVISDRYGQVQLNSDTLYQINLNPENYELSCLDWNIEKEEYVDNLAKIFSKYVIEEEKMINAYEFVVNAIKRWYLALSKFAKDTKKYAYNKNAITFLKLLRQNFGSQELIFNKIPMALTESSVLNSRLTDEIKNIKESYDNCVQILKKDLSLTVKKTYTNPKNKNDKISLYSVICDWNESLEPKVFEQLFLDGTEKCLELYKNITNDELLFVSKLAKIATDLRIEDWDDSTIKIFDDKIKQYKATAEGYQDKNNNNDETTANSYQLTFVFDDGKSITKRFDRVEESNRGKLLRSQIMSNLEAMGRAITEQEKRQILMEILKELC